MRRLALSVLIVAALAVLAASSSAEAPTATAAAKCSGSVDRKINGHKVHAHKITTYGIGCSLGKRVVRKFLKKADRHQSCNRASKRPPPTKGCLIGHFHCFRNGNTYCATPSPKDVAWKE